MTGGQRYRSASTTSRRLRPESGVAGRAKELNWYPRCNSELVRNALLRPNCGRSTSGRCSSTAPILSERAVGISTSNLAQSETALKAAVAQVRQALLKVQFTGHAVSTGGRLDIGKAYDELLRLVP